MTQSRLTQVNVAETPYYHCVARCVRRAFLCGEDSYTGKNFDHRKGWVRERVRFLSSVFAVDVCAYAVMSNHLHVVWHVDRERALAWSAQEVVARYGKLFRSAAAQFEGARPKEKAALVERWRGRLWDLSWVMRSLTEAIARRANREDDCKGRFWEGRFKSQALLDAEGLLTCMAYVDLNPVRAGVARSLEASDFTSIQERLRAAAKQRQQKKRLSAPKGLAPFAQSGAPGMPSDGDGESGHGGQGRKPVPMDLVAYVDLLEWTGRSLSARFRGRLRGAPPSLLQDLGMDSRAWLKALAEHQLATATALGMPARVERHAEQRGRRWVHGSGLAKRLAA